MLMFMWMWVFSSGLHSKRRNSKQNILLTAEPRPRTDMISIGIARQGISSSKSQKIAAMRRPSCTHPRARSSLCAAWGRFLCQRSGWFGTSETIGQRTRRRWRQSVGYAKPGKHYACRNEILHNRLQHMHYQIHELMHASMHDKTQLS